MTTNPTTTVRAHQVRPGMTLRLTARHTLPAAATAHAVASLRPETDYRVERVEAGKGLAGSRVVRRASSYLLHVEGGLLVSCGAGQAFRLVESAPTPVRRRQMAADVALLAD